MNPDTLSILFDIAGTALRLGFLFLTFYIFFPEQTKALYRIRRTFSPLYKRIEEQYGPEPYPAIMSEPYCEYFGLSGLDHWDYVFLSKILRLP